MRVVLSYFRADTTRSAPNVGDYVVADARVRLPLVKELPTDIDEVTVVKRHGALLIATAKQVHVVAGASWMQCLLHEMPAWVRLRLRALLPADVFPVASAILIGDRSAIDPDDAKAYSLSGTAHMFSVSGSHVAIVVAVLMIFSGGRARLWSLVMWSVVLIIYIAITGAEPPAVRAGIMGVTALVGRYLQRDVYALNLLCASVIAMVTISPMQIYDVGFQLSVLATASLIVLPPLYNEVWERITNKTLRTSWVRRVFQMLSFSASATIGTALPSMISFASVAVAGVLINPLVIPLLSLAVLTSAAVLIPLPSMIIDPFVWITSMLVRITDALTHWAALAGIEEAPVHYRVALTLTMCTMLLWPVTAISAHRAIIRFMVGCAATYLLVVLRPPAPQAPLQACILREHGIAVYTHHPPYGRLIIIGKENAPRDGALQRWAVSLQPTPAIAGHGAWGRKMAGAIQAHVVGSGNDIIRHNGHGAGGDRGGNSR
jgi:competence protein ComEC